MCLLIAGNSAQIRNVLLSTKDLLEDIFLSNADGVGAMYTTSKGVLRTPKVLPKNLAEAHAFIAQLPNDDRSIAIHWRMRTHGDTDLTNCHPYPVIDGKIALMHNGVLSQGNAADKTKSDTWHYIADVVRPMLEVAPKMFTNKAWLELVENDITRNNRFAIMDNEGDLVILNKDTGIEHDGIWFSNTYAWTPELLIPGYKKTYKLPKSWAGIYGRDDEDEYGAWWNGTGYGGNVTAKGSTVDLTKDDEDEATYAATDDDVWGAIQACDPDEMAAIIEEDPAGAFCILMTECEFKAETGGTEPGKTDQEIIDLLEGGEMDELIHRAKTRSATYTLVMAHVICWYGTWYGKSINANENAVVAVGDPVLVAPSNEAEYEKAVQDFLAGQAGKPAPLAVVPAEDDPELVALTAGTACVSEYAG